MDKILDNPIANTIASVGAVICGISVYGLVLWNVSVILGLAGLVVGAALIGIGFAVSAAGKKVEATTKTDAAEDQSADSSAHAAKIKKP